MVTSSGPPPSCCGRLSPLLVARADEVFDRRCSLLHCVGPLMAHSDALRQRSTSVAFGAKRTLTEPRLQKAELRVDEAGGGAGSKKEWRPISEARRRGNPIENNRTLRAQTLGTRSARRQRRIVRSARRGRVPSRS